MIARLSPALVVILLTVPACATFQPSTPAEGIAASYASIESIANATSRSLADGTIDVEKAKNIRAMLEDVRTWTGAAEVALAAGDGEGAEKYLGITEAALLEIRNLLSG